MELCKKQKRTENEDDDDDELGVLIPGLPNHIANLILSTLHPAILYQVSNSWRRLIYSSNFPPFYALYALLSSAPMSGSNSSAEFFFCFDPISMKWESLPSPPVKLLHRHPSFISRILPIQSLTVSNRLVLVAATEENFFPALHSPLFFDPLSCSWFSGPPLTNPRRWCVAGQAEGYVYVFSGFGSHYRGDVARSLERWDMKKKESEWDWEEMTAFRDGRYSREAVEAVGYNGKLCIVNVKGNAVKEAATYDIVMNRWEVMPEGMRGGWNGPAAVDGGDNGLMYVVDERTGVLSRYVLEDDRWEGVIASESLRGVEQIAAGRGRVCAVCGGGARIVVVDVVAKPAKIWVVNPPPEMEVVAVHILPRMVRSSDI